LSTDQLGKLELRRPDVPPRLAPVPRSSKHAIAAGEGRYEAAPTARRFDRLATIRLVGMTDQPRIPTEQLDMIPLTGSQEQIGICG
jgi:hypothetical protein